MGAKLPSNRQVLSVFFYNTRTVKLDNKSSARLVASEIELFWNKARIPVINTYKIVSKILILYDEWRNPQKGSYSHQSAIHKQREEAFVDKLDDLFDIATSDALNKLKGVDKEFLIAQRKKGGVGCLLGIDKKNEEKETKGLRKKKTAKENQ